MQAALIDGPLFVERAGPARAPEAKAPVRSSQLQIAEDCGLAPVLAAQHPESSPAAERGAAVHVQICARDPRTEEARAALEWLARTYPDCEVGFEQPLQLRDATGSLWVAGTADVVVRAGADVIAVDWKTGRREYVEPAATNLQVWSYALAAADEWTERVGVVLVFLDGGTVTVDASEMIPIAELGPIRERIRSAVARPPVASPGAHCGRCWPRLHCEAYRARTSAALTLLPSHGGGEVAALTDESATDLAIRVRQVREACDLAESMVRSHVEGGGRVEAGGMVYGPVRVAGRRSGPSVADLEAAGLGHLVRAGQPSTRWEWRRDKR